MEIEKERADNSNFEQRVKIPPYVEAPNDDQFTQNFGILCGLLCYFIDLAFVPVLDRTILDNLKNRYDLLQVIFTYVGLVLVPLVMTHRTIRKQQSELFYSMWVFFFCNVIIYFILVPTYKFCNIWQRIFLVPFFVTLVLIIWCMFKDCFPPKERVHPESNHLGPGVQTLETEAVKIQINI